MRRMPSRNKSDHRSHCSVRHSNLQHCPSDPQEDFDRMQTSSWRRHAVCQRPVQMDHPHLASGLHMDRDECNWPLHTHNTLQGTTGNCTRSSTALQSVDVASNIKQSYNRSRHPTAPADVHQCTRPTVVRLPTQNQNASLPRTPRRYQVCIVTPTHKCKAQRTRTGTSSWSMKADQNPSPRVHSTTHTTP